MRKGGEVIKNFTEDSYQMKCFGCNATDKLTLLAHRRHEKESINGWIVLCDKCWSKYADKSLSLVYDNDDRLVVDTTEILRLARQLCTVEHFDAGKDGAGRKYEGHKIILKSGHSVSEKDKGGEVKDRIKALKDVTKIQTSNGNWNYDPYMHGMANGLLLAEAFLEGREPQFLDAPKEWLSNRPSFKAETTQENEQTKKGEK